MHFYGHTHGYSRGHAQDHRHVMVNIASAGENLDESGEYDQIDYSEHVVSQYEYGFVVVDVEAGDNPAFEIQRLSIGTASEPLKPFESPSDSIDLLDLISSLCSSHEEIALIMELKDGF